jgi:hypothetical protein
MVMVMFMGDSWEVSGGECLGGETCVKQQQQQQQQRKMVMVRLMGDCWEVGGVQVEVNAPGVRPAWKVTAAAAAAATAAALALC